MTAASVFAPGTEVRLKTDPGRRGTVIATHGQGDALRYRVAFPDGKSLIRWFDVELVSDESEDAFALLKAGRYGRLSDLRRNLTHIQLSGKLANLVYSMDTTNTDFFAYQFKPVLSFLDSPSNGLLIADEVGLGKTIEAGLIWTELRARFDARRLLVICPAMLRQKWRDELGSKFSIDAEIVDASGLMEALKHHRATVRDGKALVCGLQGARPPKGWGDEEKSKRPAARLARFLAEAAGSEPLFDLVIIDESHYLRNPETQNAALGQLLRDVTENIVLLSATPVNLKDEDLYHQLKLVDPDFFSHSFVFPQVLQANEPLVRARERVLDERSTSTEVREELVRASRHDMLSDNGQLQDLLSHGINEESFATREGRVHLADRIERINLLAHAVSRTRKVDVQEFRVVRRAQPHFVDMNEVESAAYGLVTQAIRDYADERELVSGFLLAPTQKMASSCLYAAFRYWSQKEQSDAASDDDDILGVGAATEVDDYDERPLVTRIQSEVLPQVSLAALRANDSKFETFRGLISDYLRNHPGEQVVVFSTFPGTLHYLAERLSEHGFGSEILHGSIRETKQDVIARFRANPDKTRLLLASEVASEGVDIQFCRVLVNYDLPWNPMKVEQRIGRIDRIGQSAETISILNLGHANTIDHRIFNRLLERLRIFERALGGMDAILGEEISELASDLLANKMTAEEQEQRISRSALAIQRVRHDQEELEKQASHMIAHGGYILEKVYAAHQFKKRITSEDLRVYVQDYLVQHAPGSQFAQKSADELLFDVRLAPDVASRLDEYMRQLRLHGQSRLATGDTVRCLFKNRLNPGKGREEWINQFHPLIRLISRELREAEESFHPLVAASVNASELEGLACGTYAFAVHRWAFSGLKEDEELRCRAQHLQSGKVLNGSLAWDLVSRSRLAGEDWPGAPAVVDSGEAESALLSCLDSLEKDFAGSSREREVENQDRVKFQISSAKRHLERQREIIHRQIETLTERNNTKMLVPTRARLKKVEERFERIELQLKERMALTRHYFDVCMGVLQVTED